MYIKAYIKACSVKILEAKVGEVTMRYRIWKEEGCRDKRDEMLCKNTEKEREK